MVACHLRDAGMPGTWVQPVIVLWAAFEQPPVLSDGVAWIRGKQLEDTLARQPARMNAAGVRRAGALIETLGRSDRTNDGAR